MPKKQLDGRVQSVDRAMMLLEALGADECGNRLTDLATRTGLSPSTTHRLLTTLEHRRFVHFDPDDGMWHVGRQAFWIGSTFMRKRNFVGPALPFMRRLRDQTRETVNLGVPEQGEMVLINQVVSREITRAVSRVGGRSPMVASGMGKAILSSYTNGDVSAVVAARGMLRLTPKTLIRRRDLDAQLDAVRRDGYAIDDEEFVPGIRCVAAAIYDDRGDALGAISVSTLPSRMPHERMPALGRLMAETAREITRSIGGLYPG